MSPKILKFLYFLGCFFGWGFSTFIMGYLGKVMSFETAIFYNFIGMGLFTLIIIPKIQLGWSSYHVWAIINGVAFTVADYSYYRVCVLPSIHMNHLQLSRSGLDVSTLGPLTSLYVLMPIMLGIVFLREPVTLKKAIGIILAIVAIYLLSSEEHASNNETEEEVSNFTNNSHKSQLSIAHNMNDHNWKQIPLYFLMN